MDSQLKTQQRRAFHRVRFPIAEQPRWMIGSTNFAVVELAETSCRLALCGHEAIDLGQTWQGMVQFADGDQIWIEGTAIRLEHEAIVVRLAKGINFKKIISLQRELHRKYPTLRELNP